jgi:hypothetical protein
MHTLDNQIMNDYYEANMPDHLKPQPSTHVETVKKFIKDKYLKKLWVNDDDENPVQLYMDGEFKTQKKKKEKKTKKSKKKGTKEECKNKTKKETKSETQANSPDLIDFDDEADDFGDFQNAETALETRAKTQNDEIGDLIGGEDNDFGDFMSPENNKKDDDFGDFMNANQNNLPQNNSFQSAPSTINQAAGNSHLINNLSNLYSQSQANFDPNNKYAALETMIPQFTQQQHTNMFLGMDMNGNGLNGFHNNNNGFKAGPPPLTHQHSWSGFESTNNDVFSNQPFSTQQPTSNLNLNNQHSFGSHHNSFSSTSVWQPVAAAQPKLAVKKTDEDLFGLKATLKENNKVHKYNKQGVLISQPKQSSSSAFSGLVATQWNS